MLLTVYHFTAEMDPKGVRALWLEYLTWANAGLNEHFGINFPIHEMIEEDMRTIGKFLPPDGQLLLALADGQLAGVACMKRLTDDIAEIKRMYVRPEFRGLGVGRRLVAALIHEARKMDAATVRLDSARFMHAAHRLYRAAGFREIAPYDGSEIPPEFRHNWIFMELLLTDGADTTLT
ncbi:MAG: GNAT family N-acetyltransferase [Chloroflexi bacterium]|nr:GNAT family N-acetyltransferase [Chloroflexota bacterium]